jgi:hypothetical protein
MYSMMFAAGALPAHRGRSMQVRRQLQQLISPAMPVRAIEGHASATTPAPAPIDNVRPPAMQG